MTKQLFQMEKKRVLPKAWGIAHILSCFIKGSFKYQNVSAEILHAYSWFCSKFGYGKFNTVCVKSLEISKCVVSSWVTPNCFL